MSPRISSSRANMAVDVSPSSSSASSSSKLDPLYPPPGPPPNYPPPPPPTCPAPDPPSQSLRASPVYSATSAPIDIPGPFPPSPGPPPPYPPPPPPTRPSSTAMGVAETGHYGYGADLDVVDGDYVGKGSAHRSKSPAHELLEPHQRPCNPIVHPSKASSDPEPRNEHQAIRVIAPIATRTPIYTRNRPAPLNLDYHTRPQVMATPEYGPEPDAPVRPEFTFE